EIHVDCRTDEERRGVEGKTLVNNDHPQVIEIWNNVFIQYNRKKDGSLEGLPATHVDTGMGFERLVRVLQGKQSNYDTDVFSGTIAEIEKLSGKKYGGSDDKPDVAFRVIADHIRAIAFPISDGQLPSNTGPGYVIRRILRRAVRYYFTYLEIKQPVLHKLMPLIAVQFEHVFPEVRSQLDFVSKVVFEEEQNFIRTLDAGLKRLQAIKEQAGEGIIDGKAAFELFDTFGFPIDLTRLIAAESDLAVDEEGFNSEMQLQKDRSRSAAAQDTGDWVVVHDKNSSSFVGYEQLQAAATVTRYRKMISKDKEAFQLVLDSTPFYAESGGQVGDTGVLEFGDEKITIHDTKKDGDLIIHFANKLPAKIDEKLVARVNESKRWSIATHHTATHLLHSALRKILGTHVSQKGSLVNESHLRFDFSHFAKLTDEEIAKVDAIVNEKIRSNIEVVINILPKEEALALGAMALFGEKYGDKVRVVIIDPAYSIELCGGTHVGNTGELGFFKLTHEAAIAAGVRRIEAVAGISAEKYLESRLQELKQVREQLKNPKDLAKTVSGLLTENSDLLKQLQKLEQKHLGSLKEKLLTQQHAFDLGEGTKGTFIGEIVEVNNADALKKLCFDLKPDLKNYMVALASNIEGKAQVVIMLDEAVVTIKGLEAPKLIKEYVAPLIKGGGGGQNTLATAGGQDASNLPAVIEKLRELVR
ncbi:MAG: alanine--tRNA ligase, partial [Chitinophagaceae bacterium]